jgi:hypothetical protein
MAKTLEQLQAEFDAISEKTRIAFDRLNARSGSEFQKYPGENLSKKYSIAIRRKDQEAIDELKPIFEAAQKEYKQVQEQKNTLRKELDAAKKTAESEKTSAAKEKSAVSVYQKTLDELSKAELAIDGYKGEEKYRDAYRKAEQAYNNAIKSGVSVTPLGSPKVAVPPLAVAGAPGGKAGTPVAAPENISAFIGTLADPANSAILKQVQQDLVNNFGYKGPVDGKYSLPLQNAINSLATNRSSLPVNLQGTDFRTFLADKASSALLGMSATGAAGGSGGTSVANYIADATQAAATVTTVIQRVLNREPSAKEIKDLSAILIDAQKKNPYKTTNGIRTGGINEEQLLTDVINSGTYAADKKLGKLSTLGKLATEVKTRKVEGQDLEAQKIKDFARSNLLSLSDVQVNNFLADLKAGQSLETINKRIRSIASMGMPDSIKEMVASGVDLETIYQPYKNRMASILELNPQSININDSTLRAAIGPDKEMPLYEFEKALRKDSRWQYTNNARQEVSNVALRVLKDFGLQG